ncbi:MAG TPA: hypothetical protein DEQ56_01805 [Bacteroidetes bacterium]|jgi:ligand-binding sensor domain-containing protein|nr:hypothetical protein [Bacteroidota bacterium]
MRLIYTFYFFLIGLSLFAQNNTPTYTWRMHLPYNSVRQIIEVDRTLYVLAEVGLYTFDLISGESTMLTKVDGFAESKVSNFGYSSDTKTLIIVYENGNIDLLKDNKIINLPGLKRASVGGQKFIYETSVIGRKAYLATSFGVVVVDLEKQLISADYQNLGAGGTTLEVFSIFVFNDTLYLATDEGIKSAPAYDSRVNLQNFETWKTNTTYKSTRLLREFNNNLFFVNDSILYNYASGSYSTVEAGVKKDYKSLITAHDKLVICRWEGVALLDKLFKLEEKKEPFMEYAIIDYQNNLWFGGFYRGLIKKWPDGRIDGFIPPGPYGLTTYDMQGYENTMYVTAGGHTNAYAPSYVNYGYYIYEDGQWLNRDLNNPVVGSMIDFTNIYINQNSGDVYLGSFGSGLAKLKNKVPDQKFTSANSTIKAAVDTREIALGMTQDSKGTLWVANYETEKPLLSLKKDGSWKEYNVGSNRIGEMVVDDQDNIWMLAPRSSSLGLVVVKENSNGGVVDRPLTTGAKNGGLPNNNVKAIVLDKDGEIWVGTETGIGVFYQPSLVFNPQQRLNADAQQIIIDDGIDIGYLLEKEVINDLKVDGGNRKWAATNNGVWLIAEDGSRILKHFTASNSPLPSDIVNCIGIVPNTGEVFFGTTQGITSYRGDATEAGTTHQNTLVFPNPVHSTYQGPITITGLPEDATVKIADVAGRVVYELIATGGTAVWNGLNFEGQKPQTGIYLIYSANKDDEEALVTKLLIVR